MCTYLLGLSNFPYKKYGFPWLVSLNLISVFAKSFFIAVFRFELYAVQAGGSILSKIIVHHLPLSCHVKSFGFSSLIYRRLLLQEISMSLAIWFTVIVLSEKSFCRINP